MTYKELMALNAKQEPVQVTDNLKGGKPQRPEQYKSNEIGESIPVTQRRRNESHPTTFRLMYHHL